MAEFPIPSFSNPDRSRLRAAFPRVEAVFRDSFKANPSPGLSYGVVVDGELALAGGFGIQNIETKAPVTPDSVFRIASMTKSFTAMSLMKLRDEGKLRLDAPVAEYVPELAKLRYPTRDSAPITVRNLLTMSGGLPQDDPWADRQLADSEQQLSDLMNDGLTFSNPPGVTYEYSNFGFAILGRIVTNVSGVLYQTYVKENILKPLGMTSSTFDIDEVDLKHYAMGYRRENNQWIEEPPLADGSFASIGGLFTTISDFARYMAFLLSAFPPRDDAESGPVRRSSLREMQQAWRTRFVTSTRTTPDAPAWVQSDSYAFGLTSGIDSLLGYSVTHGGGLPGYGTFYRLLPDCGIGIVAFTNLTYNSTALPINKAFYALQTSGAVVARVLPTAPALTETQQAIRNWYESWDNADAIARSTDSFWMDLALEKRRQQFADLRKSFGKCTSVTTLEPENALRGRWLMKCRNGNIEVFVTLSPTIPSKIMCLTLTLAKKLSPDLKALVAQVVAVINQWDDAAAQKLFAHTIQRGALQTQFEALHIPYGALRLGDVIGGDGKTQTCVRLIGKRGSTDLKIVVNTNTGKVKEISFSKPREINFVP
ncbi:MAG: serine hydrolase domain-containing protein [Chloroflexota bacterium]